VSLGAREGEHGKARFDEAVAAVKLALAEYEQAKVDDDINLTKTALAIALAARGSAYYGKKDSDRAIADYNEAIRLDPDNTSVYFSRGRILFGRGEFAAAIPDLRRASETDSDSQYGMLWLYLARARAGRR
jgi:tetratricopeptide (TPR) repeat protein